MATEQRQSKSERINVRFPRSLLEELRRSVPARQRSTVIVAGTAIMLAELKQKQALRAGAGAWTDENHPDLHTQEDINRYLGEIRGSMNARLSRDPA